MDRYREYRDLFSIPLPLRVANRLGRFPISLGWYEPRKGFGPCWERAQDGSRGEDYWIESNRFK
jgi:hypothetical protein